MNFTRLIPVLVFAIACNYNQPIQQKTEHKINSNNMTTEDEWKNKLDDASYNVLRKKGTERAFTGKFNDHWDSGFYTCKGCGQKLFSSETKFNAGCGWPSFFDVLDTSAVKLIEDRSHGMIRTEVVCSNCGGHLGHLFDDGPNPTGQRFCINSVSLDFKQETKDSAK